MGRPRYAAASKRWPRVFGPAHPRHLARIGDVVITCTGDTAVPASGHDQPEAARLVGFHGGATVAETALPMIVFHGETPLLALSRSRGTTSALPRSLG